MKHLKVIILAAGKGVRMKSDIPKILHRLCGKPIIQYVIDLIKSVGVQNTCIVLGYKSSVIAQYLKKENVSVVIQKRLIGTADAVKQALLHSKKYKGDILVLCGDTPLLRKETIKALVRRHRNTKAACTILSTVVDDPKGYGRVLRKTTGDVVAIREEKDASSIEKHVNEINTGVYCFRGPEFFKAIKSVRLNKKKGEFYLTDIVELLVRNRKKVKVLKAEDSTEGLGINTREDLALAQMIIRQKILHNFMLQGITMEDPDSTYIDADVKLGRDTTIRPFTIIENDVRIGRRCLIGPFCRIRPGTNIGNDVEIGNFTEISRTTLGDRCFMKHFSFLGDAKVGRRVNVGAGVVTANFDGRHKNITRISDDVFIGSDSILIAPLEIGKKAVTGAGCVVTRGQKIPRDSVVMGVPAKITARRKRS